MNALSVLVVLAMLFSGSYGFTGDLPPVPAEQKVETVSGLSVTLGETTYALESSLVGVSALGENAAYAGFYAEKDGKTRMPFSCRMTAEGIDFAVNDTDNYYTVPSSLIAEASGGESGIFEELFPISSPLAPAASFIDSMKDLDSFSWFMKQYTGALLEAAGPDAREKEITVNGRVLEGYEIDMDDEREYAALQLVTAENEDLKAAADAFLQLANSMTGATYSSVYDFVSGEGITDEAGGHPYTCVLAANEDRSVWYHAEQCDWNMEGGESSYLVEMIRNGDVISVKADFTTTEVWNGGSYNVTLSLYGDMTAEGEFALTAELSGAGETETGAVLMYGPDGTGEWGEAMTSFAFEIGMTGNKEFSVTSVEGTNTRSLGEENLDISFSAGIASFTGEDGTVTSELELEAAGIPEIGTLSVSLTYNVGFAPLEEPFTGTQYLFTLDISEDRRLQTVLTADVMGFASDVVDVLAEAGIDLGEDFDPGIFASLIGSASSLPAAAGGTYIPGYGSAGAPAPQEIPQVKPVETPRSNIPRHAREGKGGGN